MRELREERSLRAGFRLPALAAFVLVIGLLGSVTAQDLTNPNRLEVGIASQVVANAWNPLRFISRDTPPATLTVTVDQGSLRQGSVPMVLQHQIPGGAGVSVFETLIYLNSFSGITWTLRTADATLASGSIAGRDADARPLDLVVSREPGRLRAAYPPDGRLVDVPASSLSLESAAYSGVRTLVIDGTSAAPRLEAVAAAAIGGVHVILHGALPASHAELALLFEPGAASARLGAGTVTRTGTQAISTLAVELTVDRRVQIDDLIGAFTAAPLVTRPASAPQPLVLTVAAAFALLCVLLVRSSGGPGLIGALALAAILSFASWRVLRPPEPLISGAGRIGISGGALALVVETQEHLTLPPSTIEVRGGARPLTPVPYRIGAAGAAFDLARWRSLVVALPQTVEDAPLRFEAGELRNAGRVPLVNVHVVGLGHQGRLEPGSRLTAEPQESALAPTALYTRLEAQLPAGSALATSCSQVCTVWILAGAIEGEARP